MLGVLTADPHLMPPPPRIPRTLAQPVSSALSSDTIGTLQPPPTPPLVTLCCERMLRLPILRAITSLSNWR
jgi:hypothetical protein